MAAGVMWDADDNGGNDDYDDAWVIAAITAAVARSVPSGITMTFQVTAKESQFCLCECHADDDDVVELLLVMMVNDGGDVASDGDDDGDGDDDDYDEEGD
eukprot:3333216-Pyramimonas_sp.AAC.1